MLRRVNSAVPLESPGANASCLKTNRLRLIPAISAAAFEAPEETLVKEGFVQTHYYHYRFHDAIQERSTMPADLNASLSCCSYRSTAFRALSLRKSPAFARAQGESKWVRGGYNELALAYPFTITRSFRRDMLSGVCLVLELIPQCLRTPAMCFVVSFSANVAVTEQLQCARCQPVHRRAWNLEAAICTSTSL
jgi:hypothetical protein